MKNKILTLLFVFVLLLTAVPSFADVIDLDLSFSDDGIALDDPNLTPGDEMVAMTLDNLGRVVTCGKNTEENALVLTRYGTDGNIDTTFGSSGVAIFNLSVFQECTSLFVDANGKILVTGVMMTSLFEVFVARFNDAGELDTGFGDGTGFMNFSVDSSTVSIGTHIAEADSGNVMVFGLSVDEDVNLFVAKVDGFGSLNESFGGSGGGTGITVIESSSEEYPIGMDIDSTGRIILASIPDGTDDLGDLMLVRLTSFGELDSSFDSDGVLVISEPTDEIDAIPTSMVLDSSDQILVSLDYIDTTNNNNHSVAVVRFDSVGAVDSTFGENGVASVDVSNDDEFSFPSDLTLDSNGNILVSWFGEEESNALIGLVRFTSSGILDTNFTNDQATPGYISTNISDESETVKNMALDTNGNIFIGGNVGQDNYFIVKYQVTVSSEPTTDEPTTDEPTTDGTTDSGDGSPDGSGDDSGISQDSTAETSSGGCNLSVHNRAGLFPQLVLVLLSSILVLRKRIIQ